MATAALLAMTACGGGGGDGPVGPGGGGGGGGGATVTQITLSPGPSSITAGQTVTFTAQPKDASGAAVSGQTVTWTSNPASVATVVGGTVTGVSAGASTITASIGSVSNTVVVTVTAAGGPAPVATVTVSPDSTALATGAAKALTAVLKDASGQTLSGRTVAWSSSDNTKAQVNSSGVVTGVAVGTVTITASSEGKVGTAKVVVLDDHAAPTILSLTVSPTSVNVATGAQTVTISARIQDVGSGTNFFFVNVKSPSKGPFEQCSASAPVSGTMADGTFTCTITIARGAENGDWQIDVVAASDVAGNLTQFGNANLPAGFPTKFTVVSPTPDRTPPVIVSLTVTPVTVDVRTGAQIVTATARITDDNSGVVRFDFALITPDGKSSYSCTATTPSSGTTNDGTWTCSLTIPASGASGDYPVVVRATDGATFFREHNPTAGYPTGFPTKVTVTGK